MSPSRKGAFVVQLLAGEPVAVACQQDLTIDQVVAQQGCRAAAVQVVQVVQGPDHAGGAVVQRGFDRIRPVLAVAWMQGQ